MQRGGYTESGVRPVRILLGHSLGGICASLAALDQAAQRTAGTRHAQLGDAASPIAAVVLVAPAVIAMQSGLQGLVEMRERLPSAFLGK
jgi:alpha-beta hydrolase superfamily lysophospholipase